MVQSEKRQEILHAALAMIAEHGFHGAPIADIADRAGVGAGTIYCYFTTKDILITELFQQLHDKIYTRLLKGYEANKPHRERFIYLSTSLLHYFLANPLEFRFLEQYLSSPYSISFWQELSQGMEESGSYLYRRLFEEGVAMQIMKDLSLNVFFALAFGPLLAMSREHILGFIVLDEVLITKTIKACWDAVKR
jgi:AcrR family transcriptional regulator